jgi:hypothetical protein
VRQACAAQQAARGTIDATRQALPEGATMNVHACLSAEARHDKVWITFKIENRGERRVWLPRALAADAALGGPLFALRVQPEGNPVAYVGAMAPPGAPAKSDWFELAPHSAHTHTIDITPAYAFPAGAHDFELRYEGVALGDIQHPEATTPLVTDPVVFRHAA